jgi:hypothetical protein
MKTTNKTTERKQGERDERASHVHPDETSSQHGYVVGLSFLANL